MKANAIMIATALGLGNVFNPKLPKITTNPAKSKRVISPNPYIKKNKQKYANKRDLTYLFKFLNRSHTAHQGKKECSRRVIQMANGADCGQYN